MFVFPSVVDGRTTSLFVRHQPTINNTGYISEFFIPGTMMRVPRSFAASSRSFAYQLQLFLLLSRIMQCSDIIVEY